MLVMFTVKVERESHNQLAGLSIGRNSHLLLLLFDLVQPTTEEEMRFRRSRRLRSCRDDDYLQPWRGPRFSPASLVVM